jgi:hypothetical protein
LTGKIYKGQYYNHLLNLEYKGEVIGTIDRLNEAIKDDEWLNADNGVNRKATKDSHLHIGNNLIVGKVQSFKGFNNYSPYLILAKYINTDNIEVEDVIHVNYYAVLKLEEF